MFTVQASRMATFAEGRASVAYRRFEFRWLIGCDIMNRARFESEPK